MSRRIYCLHVVFMLAVTVASADRSFRKSTAMKNY